MYDVIIIGGGPGGYVAAVRAAQLGGRVALVEEQELGGTCLNRGCIPTKALLETARRYREIGEAASFGIRVGDVVLDFPAVVARQRQVVSALRSGVASLLSAAGVTVESGRGSVLGQGRVQLTRAALGGIDILVNNAGVGRPTPSLLALPEEQWDATLAVNLKGPFLVARADHQDRLAGGPLHQRTPGSRLHSLQGGPAGADPAHGPGAGPPGDYGQRRLPRHGGDRPGPYHPGGAAPDRRGQSPEGRFGRLDEIAAVGLFMA